MQLMRTSLYTFAITALALSAPSANGQSVSIYGIEDEVKISQPQTHPINTQPITLQEAIDTFREFQAAFLNEDLEYMLSILGEPEKSAALARLKTMAKRNKNSLVNYVNYGRPIVTWKIKCGACWDDVDGQQCALEDRRYMPSKHNNEYSQNIYLLEKRNGSVFITDRTTLGSKLGRKLKKKQKNNDRNCDLDEYDLQIGKKNKTNAAKSFLKGVIGVAGALGN